MRFIPLPAIVLIGLLPLVFALAQHQNQAGLATAAPRVSIATGAAPNESTHEIARQARALVSFSPADIGYRTVVRRRVVDAPPTALRTRSRQARATVVVPSPRAKANPERRTITLFVADGDAPHRVAHELAHELGEAYDREFLDDADRRGYLAARGAERAAWRPADDRDANDLATGEGDFAEVFASCYAASTEFRSTLAPKPRSACALIPARSR